MLRQTRHNSAWSLLEAFVENHACVQAQLGGDQLRPVVTAGASVAKRKMLEQALAQWGSVAALARSKRAARLLHPVAALSKLLASARLPEAWLLRHAFK